jgi:hypothetical protein
MSRWADEVDEEERRASTRFTSYGAPRSSASKPNSQATDLSDFVSVDSMSIRNGVASVTAWCRGSSRAAAGTTRKTTGVRYAALHTEHVSCPSMTLCVHSGHIATVNSQQAGQASEHTRGKSGLLAGWHPAV